MTAPGRTQAMLAARTAASQAKRQRALVLSGAQDSHVGGFRRHWGR